MKITEKELKKYAEGTCSPEEVLAVEAWIADNTDAESQEFTQEFEAVESKIWQNIKADFPTKVIPMYQKVVKFTAAACVIGGVIGSGVHHAYKQYVFDEHFVASNSGEDEIKTLQSADLDFALQPKSSIDVVTNLYGNEGKVKFSGNLELSNHSLSDIDVQFVSEYAKSGYTQSIKLRKGKKYLVFSHEFEQYKINVLDAKKVHLLPPPLEHKVLKEFNI